MSLALLCSCSPQSGGGGGGGEDWRLVQARTSAHFLRLRLGPLMRPLHLRLHLRPDCLLTWPLLLSNLITAYKSESLLLAVQPSLHSNGERVSLGPILIKPVIKQAFNNGSLSRSLADVCLPSLSCVHAEHFMEKVAMLIGSIPPPPLHGSQSLYNMFGPFLC